MIGLFVCPTWTQQLHLTSATSFMQTRSRVVTIHSIIKQSRHYLQIHYRCRDNRDLSIYFIKIIRSYSFAAYTSRKGAVIGVILKVNRGWNIYLWPFMLVQEKNCLGMIVVGSIMIACEVNVNPRIWAKLQFCCLNGTAKDFSFFMLYRHTKRTGYIGPSSSYTLLTQWTMIYWPMSVKPASEK